MDLRYNKVENLPYLAWCAEYDFSTSIMTIMHGIRVETQKTFLVEGVWDGDFTDGAFTETDCFFGSGVRMKKNECYFIPSSSTTDYLYYSFTKDKQFCVSNSLPLHLASIGDELDPQCFDYEKINRSITDGIYDYIEKIPTKLGYVNRLMYHNLIFDGDKILLNEKKLPDSFATYASYRSYLGEKYELIYKNVKDKNRESIIDIFSTQSRGYDSTAVNSIAFLFGIDNVFSIKEAKEPGTFVTYESGQNKIDDGTEICKILKTPCTLIKRKAYVDDFSDEYLYYAGMHICEDANLKGINSQVKNVTLLLTGNLGEIWYTRKSYYENKIVDIDSSLKRGDLGGHGLGEIRLKYGFIQLPLPFIGARRRQDIFNITHSEEMNPWRLNNKYDRPIPRRIAEESGVPREYFGQKKMATVTEFPTPQMPVSKLLREQYFVYLVENKTLSRIFLYFIPVIHYVNLRITFSKPTRFRYVYYAERLLSRIFRNDFKFKPIFRKYNGSLYCFCVNKRASEYKRVLSNRM